MAVTLSSMMDLGTGAPRFTLPDTVSGLSISLDDGKKHKGTVVLFICNHCPFVIHLNAKLVEVAKYYKEKDIRFLAISSNNVVTHPQDGPEYMKKTAEKEGYPFPYLYDETQEVAKAYGAECTPDFFVFNKDLKCVYRGRFDETRPNMGKPTGKDLTFALDALIAGNQVSGEQYPSMGCNIKWKD